MSPDLFGETIAAAPPGASAPSRPTSAGDRPWWSSLRHGGCLISPSRLAEFFPSSPSEPLSDWTVGRLRRDIERYRQINDKDALDRLFFSVTSGILGLDHTCWKAGPNVGEEWSVRALTGEMLKPRRVWQYPDGGLLPVFIPDEAAAGPRSKTPALGLGRGRRSVARVVEWLRRKGHKIALLTNGHQWRLIHAGPDYDAWCEWDTDAWFEEGHPGPQVDALRLLLGFRALTLQPPLGKKEDETKERIIALVAAIQATRRGQAELSAALGERVRQAVELLLRESGKAIDDARAASNVANRDVYIAAVRLVMRLVVVLFAESRLLLPIDKFPVYERSYSLATLITMLDREGGGRPLERLRDREGAWPRVMALFRLLYHGVSHDLLNVMRYGGGLFEPGDSSSTDPVLRALAVLENPRLNMSDGIVAVILELLTKAPVKVRQGRAATVITAPVDFSQLDTEYIGILYEGLLDYELRRVEHAIPIVFLSVGDQPALPLTRLEEMDDKALAELVKKLGKPASKKKGEEAESEDSDADDDAEEIEDEDQDSAQDEQEIQEVPAVGSGAELDSPIFDDVDSVRLWRERALKWSERAVIAGKLVPPPKAKKTPEKTRAFENAVAVKARALILRIFVPGEYYLVRFGGTRKGSGTFYTKPQLARPTVRRTLEPLCYGKSEDESLKPRTPAEILELKVCDPACGSGSFLVGALRYLSSALYDSLLAHDWLTEQADGRILWGSARDRVPPWFAETLADVPGINEPAPRPDDTSGASAEDRIRSRLKRVVVERCIYGVDLDPLAVELARLALWAETMDPFLPFSFLDHKIKCGNALVGCWFDRFQDYPAMAWEREGGDKTHTTGVHFAKETWTRAIKTKRAEMKHQLGPQPDLFIPVAEAEKTFVDALHLYETMHAAGLHEQDKQAASYEDYRKAVAVLRRAFDSWCALWFWPAEKLDIAPLPSNFGHPTPETANEITRLVTELRFFHWELEFPDAFNQTRHGFSAIVGNPPWEIQKPSSKEWFSNVDPLYRTYGKQEALVKQKALFAADRTEHAWLLYNAQLKGLGNWCKNAGAPFDKQQPLRRGWSFADPEHPFHHQGSADVNTYKLFLEVAHALLSEEGRLGLILPSGIYSDAGSGQLRSLLTLRCTWSHLYAFQNEKFIFENVHHSFKIVILAAQKGAGPTSAMFCRFRLGPGDSPEANEVEEDLLADHRYQKIALSAFELFSPKSKAVLEIRSKKDLSILEKIYSNGVQLGDSGPDGWGIKFASEFHMTNDSKLFPPRPQWEANGYVADEYGHWLKGKWRVVAISSEGCFDSDVIRSRDGSQVIALGKIEDGAVPLYQGIMINFFDLSSRAWAHGSGAKAVWESVPRERKLPGPQYLMGFKEYSFAEKAIRSGRVAYRHIARTTDSRTWIGCALPNAPSGNSLFLLVPRSDTGLEDVVLSLILSSFCYDWQMRGRLGGTNLNWFILEETAAPRPISDWYKFVLAVSGARLIYVSSSHASSWLSILDSLDATTRDILLRTPWRRLWAMTPHERLRLRCILDAVVARLYGFDEDDFRWILRDCDHPEDKVTNKAFARALDPKGFWRVEKTQPRELRHTVLAQVAFADLQSMIAVHGEEEALFRFLGSGPDDGWMLPETLRLADYGLGHDDRASQPQKVAEVLGPRFYEWQLSQSAEESWAECRMHAENIRRIRSIGAGTAFHEQNQEYAVDSSSLDGPEDGMNLTEQDDLFAE